MWSKVWDAPGQKPQTKKTAGVNGMDKNKLDPRRCRRKNNAMKLVIIFGLLITLTVTGCATDMLKTPKYTSDYATIDDLKRQNLSKVVIGAVTPKRLNEKVNNIILRGNPLVSSSKSYAQYLEDALRRDMADANLLDSKSVVKLSTLLLKNEIDVSDSNTGYGLMEARFTTFRNGYIEYDKFVSAEIQFESSSSSEVAISNARNHYPVLVRALLNKLYSDEEFIDALHK